jgi:hypothetical protein
MPTGTVTFFDGSTILGTATLNGGAATFSTSELALGQHNITAVYGGDANNLGSTSSVLAQTVLSQIITFNALPPIVSDAPDFDPGARASSELPVTYTSSNTAVATIVNGLVHLVGPGTTTITASQSGNAIYSPATNVQQTLTVIPATPLEVFVRFTIPGSVSLSWGAGTTGKAAGDVTPLDWTVLDSGGSQLGHGETCASNDANNNVMMILDNSTNTGSNAHVNAAILSSGGWTIAGAPSTDTFAIQAQLGANPVVALGTAAQELTAMARLAKAADQALVLTVMTPTAVTQNTGVPTTIFLALTATPE